MVARPGKEALTGAVGDLWCERFGLAARLPGCPPGTMSTHKGGETVSTGVMKFGLHAAESLAALPKGKHLMCQR